MTNPSFDNTIILIPARMASTRLPGKPLADIAGLPMIVQVAKRAAESGIGRVTVAVDHVDILEAVRAAGFDAVMTKVSHQSGSDRIHEALGHADPDRKAAFIVNVQGDLPTIEPETIRASLRPLENADTDIATLTVEITHEAERPTPTWSRSSDRQSAPRACAGFISPGRRRLTAMARSTITSVFMPIAARHWSDLSHFRHPCLKSGSRWSS
jgi:CMP-2-keto-3-deoxyoctulosonic acid synthetase